ncbi:MAG TPA: hypothetical protein VGZ48_09470 [Candidatus Acidoferrales bacterium]|jgi:hypothetical protein|nr:hypothetical protein [Candidatus Acidoferrales bacterium]
MDRLFRVLVVLILLELGIGLIALPWLRYWEHNYFLDHYPDLIHILLHPAMRGAVSGLGILDIIVAISLLRQPVQQARQ